jgi:hypothetical protein
MIDALVLFGMFAGFYAVCHFFDRRAKDGRYELGYNRRDFVRRRRL